MEKGLKTLSTVARTAHRKASVSYPSTEERGGISDQNSDSGIGFGSDAETELGPGQPSSNPSAWHAHETARQSFSEHVKPRGLPQPLPLYQPPPPIVRRDFEGTSNTTSPQEMSFGAASQTSQSRRCSPDSQSGRGGISIQSVLSS